jgi:hypothetical protein
MVILSSALAFMVSSAVSRAEACAPTPAIHPRSALVCYFNLPERSHARHLLLLAPVAPIYVCSVLPPGRPALDAR